jgi:hypothetical protein
MKKINLFILAAVTVLSIFSSCKKEIIVETEEITTSTTWTSKGKYVVNGTVSIKGGAILTIEPGATIEFGPDGRIDVGYYDNATFIAIGTEKDPIVFTSNHPTPTAGAWAGIYFWGYTQENSAMKWCEIEYAGANDEYAIKMQGCKIAIDNCTIKKSGNGGIKNTESDGVGGFVSFTSNTFKDLNDEDYAVSVQANFVHTMGAGNIYEEEGIEIYGDYEQTTNKTWLNQGIPYYVTGSINVNGNLTIAPGTTFKFSADQYFSVGYYENTTLIAEGTADQKITFTSAHASPTAGAWEAVMFWNNVQATTSLKYCDILYAGNADDNGAVEIQYSKITFQNCHIAYSQGYGVYAWQSEGFTTPFQNNTIDNCDGPVMAMNLLYLSTLGTGNTFTPAENTGITIGGEDYESSTNQTWIAQSVPYYVPNNFNITGNLTLGSGCIFKLGSSVDYISVGYYSNSTLTADNVTFTSSAYTPNAGDWGEIEFWNNAQSCSLTNCTFLYGGNGDGMIDIRGDYNDVTTVNLQNCEVGNSSTYGIYGNAYATVSNQASIDFHDNASGDYFFETK